MALSFVKRVNKEIQMYSKDNFIFPNFILRPTEDLSVWYFIIYDLKDTCYENGIYLGKVSLPPRYPFKAPDFVFLTDTGRFQVNKKICTSFTGFHPELYSPSWNICSLCAGLISFMTDPTDSPESKGIGYLESSSDTKKDIAAQSRSKILSNTIFQQHFKEYMTEFNLVNSDQSSV